MKRSIKLLAGILALGLAAGCSKEPVDNGQTVTPPTTEDAVYMNVDLKLATPNGTRSQTNAGGGSTSGNEIGQDFENNVNTLLLVLTTTDDKYITHATIGGLSTATVNNKAQVSATMKFDKTMLNKYYETKPESNEIHVYAFCNYTTHLLDEINKLTTGAEWVNTLTCHVTEVSPSNDKSNEQNMGTAIWDANNFLMSNADNTSFTKYIPNTIEEWDNYTSETHPFHLSKNNDTNNSDKDLNNDGAIKVERSVARFDFKDGSKGNNTYTIQTLKDEDGKDTDKPTLQVQLVRMALTNMSKNFYYIRRVSEAKDGYSDPKILGTETDKNFVVDTDADEKSQNLIGTENYGFSKYFNFCLGNGDTFSKDSDKKTINWTIDEQARNQWYSSLITDVLGKNPDNNDSWNPDNKKGDYYIWRYVTENTIPASDGQLNGVSTGVIFKGMLKAGEALKEDTRLWRAINGLNPDNDSKDKYTTASEYPILYIFDNVPYVKWTDVEDHALNKVSEGSPLKAAYDAVNEAYKAWDKDRNNAELTAAFKKAATGAGFTLYQASSDKDCGIGYYFYYYYWNRHNDNGNPGIMGNMEFGVVRNNVYKLSVTDIKRLGHPRLTENDPDPKDPDDPDESGDVYLDVSVEVLPWVVRENNIEF